MVGIESLQCLDSMGHNFLNMEHFFYFKTSISLIDQKQHSLQILKLTKKALNINLKTCEGNS